MIVTSLIFSAAISAMYSDQFIVAALLYVVAVVWLAAKALTCKQTVDHVAKSGIRIVVVAAGLIFLGLLLWWTAYTHEHQAIQRAQSFPESVRIKYSSTQTVQWSTVPGDYNESLNLDNVALLTYVWDANLDQIGMALTTSAPITVDNPKPDVTYRSGGASVEFPGAGKPGVTIKGGRAVSANAGNYFLFNRHNATTHTIIVNGRNFRVTLLDVRDRTKQQSLIEYRFGISEE